MQHTLGGQSVLNHPATYRFRCEISIRDHGALLYLRGQTVLTRHTLWCRDLLTPKPPFHTSSHSQTCATGIPVTTPAATNPWNGTTARRRS
jgi:hypothetical protein